MRERHTGEVISTLYTLLKTEVAGKSPMTVAATKIGTSYQTLRRKLVSGKLSLNEFEMLCDLLERDPAAVYSHPELTGVASGTAQDVQKASGQAPSQSAPMRQTAPGSASANTGTSNQRFSSSQLPAASNPSFGGSAPLDDSHDGMASRCKVFGEQAACDAMSGD